MSKDLIPGSQLFPYLAVRHLAALAFCLFVVSCVVVLLVKLRNWAERSLGVPSFQSFVM